MSAGPGDRTILAITSDAEVITRLVEEDPADAGRGPSRDAIEHLFERQPLRVAGSGPGDGGASRRPGEPADQA